MAAGPGPRNIRAMEHSVERLLSCASGAAQAVQRRLDVLLRGPVPEEIVCRLLVTGLVRRIVRDGEPADLAVVWFEDGAVLDGLGYLAPNACVLFDPEVTPPIRAVRATKRAWVDVQPWVLPLEGPGALSEGIIFASPVYRGDIPRISCSMPVNLEVHDVERVLASFLPVAAEWVVGVDEKSDDGTLAIVERYADVVFRFRIEPWSFATARNATVDRCAYPWVFQTEGHEHLAQEAIGPLRILASQKLPQGVLMIAREVKAGEDGENDQVFYFPWVFRNHPALRFSDQNGVHNALEADAYAKAVEATEPVCIRGPSGLRTIHKAHPLNRSHRAKQRHAMNREALDTYADAAVASSRRSRALFYAQQEHASAGDLRRAVRVAVEYLRTNDSFREQFYEGHVRTAEYLLALRKPRLAAQVARRALPFDPNRVEAEVVLGDALQTIGDLEGARQAYAKAAGVPMPAYSNLFIRRRYYEDGPWKGLASVCYKLGDYGKAKNAAAAALIFDPDDETCRQLVALDVAEVA